MTVLTVHKTHSMDRMLHRINVGGFAGQSSCMHRLRIGGEGMRKKESVCDGEDRLREQGN